MTDDRPIIEVENLTKVYGLLPALKSIDFSIARGEFTALLGPNGSGKSTLLRLMCGLSRPTQGRLRIGGWVMPREAMAVRAQIGMVSHKPLLYQNLSASENLRFFAKLYHIGAAEREPRIQNLLHQLGLRPRADSLVRTFSRGMQQRLSIARALLHQPDVLFFDEPYTGLDQEAGDRLDALLQLAHQQNRTIIMSTHQLRRLPHLAGRAFILSRGRIVFDGSIKGMCSREITELYTQAISAAARR